MKLHISQEQQSTILILFYFNFETGSHEAQAGLELANVAENDLECLNLNLPQAGLEAGMLTLAPFYQCLGEGVL